MYFRDTKLKLLALSSEIVTAECFRCIRQALFALRRSGCSTGNTPQSHGVSRGVSTAWGLVGGVERQRGSKRRDWDATCAEGLNGVTGSVVGAWGVAEGGRRISSQLQKFFRERGCSADGDEGGDAMGKKAVRGEMEAEAEVKEQVMQIVEEKECWVEEEDIVIEGEDGLCCGEEEVMEEDWLAVAFPAISEALLDGQQRVDLFDVDLVCARSLTFVSLFHSPAVLARRLAPLSARRHPAAAPGAEATALSVPRRHFTSPPLSRVST